MSGSMRDALNAAFDAASENETAEAPEIEQVDAAPADEPEAPAAAQGDAEPEAPVEASEAEPAHAEDGRSRDDKGRFAKGAAAQTKPAAAKKPLAPTAKTAPTAQAKPDANAAEEPAKPEKPEQAAPAGKPPAGWGPAAREQWGKLPAEVQREVAKRERETAQVLERSAQERKQAEGARQLASEFVSAVRPFEAMIRAEGSNPIQAVDNLLRTAYQLRTAPPAHKAQLVAAMCKQFGVPLDALDAALAGQAPAQGQPQAQPQQYAQPTPPKAQEFRDPRLDQLLARQEQMLHQQYRSETDKFAEDHEFYADVAADMADFVEAAAKRKVDLSLEDAYNRAIALHPEIQQVIQQRAAVKSAATVQAATQRAKAAASSVKPHPAQAAPSASGPKSLRDQLKASWDHAESPDRV